MCPTNRSNANGFTEKQICPSCEQQHQPARRAFIERCIAGMAMMSAAIVAWPVFSFIRLPRRIGGSRPVEVPLGDLSEDQALYFNRQGTQLALIYTNQEPKLFDASCTHLGCLVTWDHNKHVFYCPCHGAIFDDQGEPVSGPVSKPLTQVKFEIKDNTIILI